MKVREFACLVGVLLALGLCATRADGPIANLNPDRSEVSTCKDTEGVGDGTPPPSWVTLLQGYGIAATGSNAIGFEMSDSRYAHSCHKLHS